MSMLRHMLNYFQEYPYKIGIASSASSGGLYIAQLLTDEYTLKVAAGAGIFLGLLLTILTIWLTILKLKKELK